MNLSIISEFNTWKEGGNVSLFNKGLWVLIALLLITLPSACDTFRGELHPSAAQTSEAPRYSFPIVFRIPAELAQRELTVSWTGALGGNETYVYPVGEASADLIRQTLRASFPRMVSETGAAGATQELPEIALEGMNIHAALGRPFWKTSSAEVRYRFALKNSAGDVLASWGVSGFAQRKGEMTASRPPPFFTAVIQQAMSEAAQNLHERISLYPEVRQALRKLES